MMNLIKVLYLSFIQLILYFIYFVFDIISYFTSIFYGFIRFIIIGTIVFGLFRLNDLKMYLLGSWENVGLFVFSVVFLISLMFIPLLCTTSCMSFIENRIIDIKLMKENIL